MAMVDMGTKKIIKNRQIFVIGCLCLALCLHSVLVCQASTALPTAITKTESSEMHPPIYWTIQVKGNKVTAVLYNEETQDGMQALMEIAKTDLESWAEFAHRKCTIILDLKKLGNGHYTLWLYEGRKSLASNKVQGFASYSIVKKKKRVWIESPAGSWEKSFRAGLTADHDPGNYVTMPAYFAQMPSIDAVSSKAVRLCRNMESDEEKVRKIHDWIAKSIAYDKESYYSRNSAGLHDASNPVWAYQNKRATCSGYARLAKVMLSAVGVPCLIVYGKGNREEGAGVVAGRDYDLGNADHEWNMVYLNGNWRILDITWNSSNNYYGSYAREDRKNTMGQIPDYNYYGIPPELFGMNHCSVAVDENLCAGK